MRNQQALLLPGRSIGHISILSRTFNHIESTFRDSRSNVGIVAPHFGRPILLKIDAAGVKARRRLDKMIAEEAAPSVA
jgi:hypothetical protein